MSPAFGSIRRGSIGLPREGVDVRLVRDGDDVGVGETGELLIKSASVMTGYWNDAAHTEAAFLDGWLRTGDLASRDADGYLHFQGRIKEIIIKGGSNIAPGEVEDVLDAHPDVELSGVVGTPDARLGALVHAFVQVRSGVQRPPSEKDLAAYASQRLAAYKVPDRWTFVDDLPKNDVGKIDGMRSTPEPTSSMRSQARRPGPDATVEASGRSSSRRVRGRRTDGVDPRSGLHPVGRG
jgi:acyl-CoA synthetase (AMP-forming)/AMP-acid ligase II